MKKKMIFSFGVVAVIGMSMWALIFGVIGGSGRPMAGTANEEKTAGESRSSDTGEEESAEVSAQTSWGLSFQQEGAAPVGNATPEDLKEYGAYYIDEEGAEEKNIYLTFDAGYENGYTSDILDVLKEEEVPATFFLVGNYIEQSPDLVKRMEKEGHTVGNHTMHHPDMASISEKEAFKKELEDLEALYKETTGKDMKKIYRPPQGKYSEENLKQASDMGYTTVFWSLAYVDWYEDKQPTREEALNKLNGRIHPGAIVLLHSTSKTNSKILQELIQGWKEQGYKFCSIDNLLT